MRTIPYEDRVEAAAVLCDLLTPLTQPSHSPPGSTPLRDAGTHTAPRETETHTAPREAETHYDCVLGLCRGGVPVAALVASHLGVPLEILIVRKLGVPGNPELAMGAIAEGGAETLNEDVIRWIPHPLESLAGARGRECEELRRRAALYRGDRPPLDLRTRHVLIVDDGAATGATAKAAIRSARARGARIVDIALPVAPPETCLELSLEADRVICPWKPSCFLSVGHYYRHFPQVSDAEVKRILQTAARGPNTQPSAPSLSESHAHAHV